MQFDHSDKKFREAAANHHPPYDEQAWGKMEKLLDKHLPLRERKRRFFFILFLSVILLGSGLLLLQSSKNSTKSAVLPVKASTGYTEITPKVDLNNPPTKILFADDDIPTTVLPKNQMNDIDDNIYSVDKMRTKGTNSTGLNIQPRKRAKTVDRFNPKEASTNLITENDFEKVPLNKKRTDNSASNNSNAVTKSETQVTPVVATNQATKPVNTKEKSDSKKKKRHIFFVALGGGPDLSYIKLNNPGRLKLFGGASLGYMYKNRVSIRAGFYTGRKIYNASASDYNAPFAFYNYYPNFQEVDANCHVYEVPISIGYHFARKPKSQMFVAAGLSSYFMKKETYKYYYKVTPASPTITKERTIANVNKHYLAGLTLSAGYTRNICKNVSLTVEPYSKIPLKGVGYGKVKLNSAGVLFSVGIQPFGNRKN